MNTYVRGLFYTAIFGVAAYAVIMDDRELTKIILPIVFLVVGWWIWKDLKVMLDRRQREREVRTSIVNQRLDLLEERLADLENRVDGL